MSEGKASDLVHGVARQDGGLVQVVPGEQQQVRCGGGARQGGTHQHHARHPQQRLRCKCLPWPWGKPNLVGNPGGRGGVNI